MKKKHLEKMTLIYLTNCHNFKILNVKKFKFQLKDYLMKTRFDDVDEYFN